MKRIKRGLAMLLAAVLITGLPGISALAADKTKITMGEPVVLDKNGVVVAAENVGFTTRGFDRSFALDLNLKDVSRETLHMNNDKIDWNTEGYEFLGWSVAGDAPLLGTIEIGTGFDKSENRPVRKLISSAGANWNFTFFVSERNVPYFYWNNVSFTEGFDFHPVFRLIDGYNPYTPLTETSTEVKLTPARRSVTPLTKDSFQNAQLLEIKEDTYGYDIHDVYYVKVPAEETVFSVDIPIPAGGAGIVRTRGSTLDPDKYPQPVSQVDGDKIHVTVEYSAASIGIIGNGTQWTAGGYSTWDAGRVYVDFNYPAKDTAGFYRDEYHRVYQIVYIRVSENGNVDGEYSINLTTRNREFGEINKSFNGFYNWPGVSDIHDRILFNKTYEYTAAGYWPTGAQIARIEKFVINGVDIPVPVTAPKGESVYKIPGMGGGTATLYADEWHGGDRLCLRFDGLYPERALDLEVVFEKLEPKYKVNVSNSGHGGKIIDSYFDRRNENGDDVWILAVELSSGYAVDKLLKGGAELSSKPIRIERDQAPYGSGMHLIYEVAVSADTTLSARYKPFNYTMKLAGYEPAGNVFGIVASAGVSKPQTVYSNTPAANTEALGPNMSSTNFYIEFETEGLLLEKTGESRLKIYAGGRESAGDAAKLLGDFELVLDGWQKMNPERVTIYIPDIGNNETFTVVYNRNGQVERTVTFQAKTLLGNKEGRELYNYYMSSYGEDRFGRQGFTDAEREGEAFKLYASYSRERFYLRNTLENALKDISVASSGDRAAKLEFAKSELELASKGIGAAVVMTNVTGYSLALVPPNVTLGYRGQGMTETRVSMAMCSALERKYPADWNFRNAGGMVAGFGKGGTGCVVGGSGMGGFLYYNGVFANVGAFGATANDGDICTFGAGGIEQVEETKSHYQQMKFWDIAVLYDTYSETELKALCDARGIDTPVSLDAVMLELTFPEVDFTRFGRTGGRELTAAEKVKKMIYSIGPVTPESGPEIKAVREAYNALPADQITNGGAFGREHNPYLQRIEEQYLIMTTPAPSDIPELAKLQLAQYAGTMTSKGSQLDTVPGMLALVTKADAEEVPNSEDVTRELITVLNNKLTGSPENVEKDIKLTGPAAYYAVLTLSLSAGAYSAANFMDSNGNIHDFTAILKDYDTVTSEGAAGVALALIALDSKPYDLKNTAIRQRYVEWLAANQTQTGAWEGDGAWPRSGVRGLAVPDPDATALALTALSNYRDNSTAEAAIQRGLSGLRGFRSEYGAMVNRHGSFDGLTTTLTVIALGALDIDAAGWKTARGDSPISAIINTRDEGNGLFLTECTEANTFDAQPNAALLAYVRTLQSKGSIFDLRDAFGEVFKLPVVATTDGFTAYAGVDEKLIAIAVAAAAKDGAKTIQLQIAVPGDGRKVVEDEYEEGYSAWAPVNDEDLNPEYVKIIPCNTVALRITDAAMEVLRGARMNLTDETEVGVISFDEGFVSEIAQAAAEFVTITADASIIEYYGIKVSVDGAPWSTSRETEIKIPVYMPDSAMVIARINGDDSEEVFWKIVVVRNAFTVKAALPVTLRVYKPSVVYGDVAADSRFANAAKFAAARKLFEEEDGLFHEDQSITLAVLMRALYRLEDYPELDIRVLDTEGTWLDGTQWLYDANAGLNKSRYNLGLDTITEERFQIYRFPDEVWFRDYLIWGYDTEILRYDDSLNSVIQYGNSPGGQYTKNLDPALGVGEPGYVTGLYNFRAEIPLTRLQVINILWNYAVYLNLDVSHKGDLTQFTDYSNVSTAEWPKSQNMKSKLEWAVYEGLITADEQGRLRPGVRMTKGDLAMSMQSMMINVSGGARGQDENKYTPTIILGQRRLGEPAPGVRSGGATGGASSPNAPSQSAQEDEQQEQNERTAPETPPTTPPERTPEPEEQLRVDTDVTQITTRNNWATALIIGAAVLAVIVATGYIISVRRRRIIK
jgi:hypothetical protein